MTSRFRQTTLVFTTAVGIIALAPATWWVSLGLLSDEAADVPSPDRMFHPIALGPTVETAIGVVSVIVAAVGMTILVGSIRRGDIVSHWWKVIAPLAALAAYAGFTYRVVTAPVVGANIGGAGLLMGAPLVGVALLSTAGFQLRRLRGPHRR